MSKSFDGFSRRASATSLVLGLATLLSVASTAIAADEQTVAHQSDDGQVHVTLRGQFLAGGADATVGEGAAHDWLLSGVFNVVSLLVAGSRK